MIQSHQQKYVRQLLSSLILMTVFIHKRHNRGAAQILQTYGLPEVDDVLINFAHWKEHAAQVIPLHVHQGGPIITGDPK